MYRILTLLTVPAIAVVLLMTGAAAPSRAAAEFVSEEEARICGLVKRMCNKVNGVRVNEPACLGAKKLKKQAGYKCGRNRQQTTAGPRACRGFVQQGRGAVVSLSVDSKNRSIFGYCVKGTGQEARQCAYQACIEKGGRYCGLPCNPQTGKEIRACKTETVTIIASNDYARLGCGARHLKAGVHTFDTYMKRELGRCLKQSKSPSTCHLEAAWQ